MFRLTHPLPEKYYIACSGGVDSMTVLHWLDKPSRRHSLLGVINIHHNTGDFADRASALVRSYCERQKLALYYHQLEGHPPKGVSKEMWWRDRRYEVFNQFPEAVIIAHNFDDCLEEYITCCMVRGYQGTIPYQRDNCIRPFRLWKRKEIMSYAHRNSLTWEEDPSNRNTRFRRNFVRHEIVPKILEMNPGVYNIVEKLVRKY